MNQRIKELAEQAETKEIGYYFFDREKFAELIIRDVYQYVDGMDTAQVISNGILKRYGVE